MCVISTLAAVLHLLQNDMSQEANPAVAQRTVPGLRLACDSNSLKFGDCSAVVAKINTGEYITLTTGTKSFCGSKGTAPKCGFRATGLMAEKPIV